MAGVLLKKGVDLVVWNRSVKATEPLVAMGARAAKSPAEVVDACETTHVMLADPVASLAVVFGAGGVLESTRRGYAYIDHSTIDEATGEKIFKGLHQHGAKFLHAPVSGGWRDAAKGELLFIAGGDRALFEAATAPGTPMAAMGHKHWLVGETPQEAARAKLMLQVMMGSMVASLSETMALASHAGIDPAQVLDMFNHSAMANPLLAAKGKLMLTGEYSPPNFQTYLQHKDLKLVQDLAGFLKVDTPITDAVTAQYTDAMRRGHADSDFAAVRTAYDPDTPRSKL